MVVKRSEKLPKTGSVEKLVELFETHDMGDYMDEKSEVDVEVKLEHRRHLVALDEDLVDQLDAAARKRKIPSQALVNTFLRAKLAEAS